MLFTALVALIGFGPAFIAAWASGNDHPEPQTYSEWRDVFRYAHSRSELQARTLIGMIRVARTFEEKLDVLSLLESDDPRKPQIIVDLAGLVVGLSIDDLVRIHGTTTSKYVRAMIRHEIKDREPTFEQLSKILEGVDVSLQEEIQELLQRLGRLTTNFEQRFSVAYQVPRGSEFKTLEYMKGDDTLGFYQWLKIGRAFGLALVMQRLIETAATFEEKVELLKALDADNPRRGHILADLERLGSDFDAKQWNDVASSASSEEVQTLAYRKIGELLD